MPRDLAPHELRLEPVDAGYAFVPLVGRHFPESLFAVRARPAVDASLVFAFRRICDFLAGARATRRPGQLTVVDLGAVAALETILHRHRRIAGQRQPLGVEIVVDLAVAGGIPALVILDAGGFLSRFVIAQQVTDLVNQQRGILLDGMRRQPSRVVVQAPPRIDGHAADEIGLDRNQIEERRREIAALMGRADARRLKRARITALVGSSRAAQQVEQPDAHLIPSARASPSA